MIPIYEEFFDGNNKDLLKHLEELPWETKVNARRELFMSTNPGTVYQYDQYEDANTYTSIPFTSEVLFLMQQVNQRYKSQYNLCFLNRYDSQHDHLGWHADDSAIMDHDHPIASISFGQPREIWFKKKGEKGKIPEAQKQLLASGSIFIMPAGFQQTHLHRIPKHDRPCGTRFSLTLRKKA